MLLHGTRLLSTSLALRVLANRSLYVWQSDISAASWVRMPLLF